VGHHADALLDGVEVATQIDLVVARRRLADALGATRPAVGDQGVVHLHEARHPVLLLRGVDVIGNDLDLGANQPALILSGPNAGGKTIALKTIALCALLVRIGCFVPANQGSRVDRFDTVLAAIGDAQTVHADLSSFSGHLLQLKEMLDRSAPGTLLLLDELASGTDPTQGAALAQALLERMLDAGPRVVVTTHFARLKALPASDPRFAAAAVELVNGSPTYRVVMGAMGESHALSIAERMGLPDGLLARATSLIDRGERDLARALEALDAQRQDAAGSQRDLDTERAELAELRSRLDRREQALRFKAKELEEQAAEAFRTRLSKAERAISQVVANLQANPSHTRVAASRATLEGLKALAPTVPEPEPVEAPALAVGDRVRIEGSGAVGEVVSLGNRVQVQTGALTVKVAADKLTRLAPEPPPRPRPNQKKKKGRGAGLTTKAGRQTPIDDALRTQVNTLDLRGKRVDEGIEEADAFLANSMMAGRDHVFLLHGHGTGAMKQAVREWLRGVSHVRRFSPANADQGGDAYTVAELA
jgi:DNA mismatch repair protein MutS2